MNAVTKENRVAFLDDNEIDRLLSFGEDVDSVESKDNNADEDDNPAVDDTPTDNAGIDTHAESAQRAMNNLSKESTAQEDEI